MTKNSTQVVTKKYKFSIQWSFRCRIRDVGGNFDGDPKVPVTDIGNGVATIVISKWENELNHAQFEIDLQK